MAYRTLARRWLTVWLTAALALAAAIITEAGPPAPAGAAPIAAAGAGAEYYLALGDSVSMWNGPQSYPDLLQRHYQASVPGLQLVNDSVSGETTSSMLFGGQYRRALAFLAAHRGHLAFMTLNIGGNDVVGCQSEACLQQGIPTMKANMVTMLRGLHAAAPGVPIYGMTYYDPLLADWLAGGSYEAYALATVPYLAGLNKVLTSIYGAKHTADVQGAFAMTNTTTMVKSKWGVVPLDVRNTCAWLDVNCQVGSPWSGGDDPVDSGARVIAQAFEKVIGGPRGLDTDAVPAASSQASSSPTWRVTDTFTEAGQLYGISCSSSQLCRAVGANQDDSGAVVATTTDGGSTWNATPAPGFYLDGVSCSGATDCTAVGLGGDGAAAISSITNGQSAWTADTVPAGVLRLDGVSCPTERDCTAVGERHAGGGAIVSTDDGGSTWSSDAVPAGAAALSAVSCVSATVCEAVGQGRDGIGIVASTDDGGVAWTTTRVPSTGGFFGVDCADADHCVAVGYGRSSAVASTTDDSGRSWQTVKLPAAYLNAVSCWSATACEVVGEARDGTDLAFSNAETETGGAWIRQHPPSTGVVVPGQQSSTNLFSLACPATDTCDVTGAAYGIFEAEVFTTVDGGRVWTTQSIGEGGASLEAVACGTANTCVAGGFGSAGTPMILTTGDAGGLWTARTAPGGTYGFRDLVCPSASVCEGIGYGIDDAPVVFGTVDGGSSWSLQAIPGDATQLTGATQLIDISCSSTSDCMIVGSAGGTAIVLTTVNGGASWQSQATPIGLAALLTVSCWTATACLAAGWNFSASTQDGGQTWQLNALPSGVDDITGLDCPDSPDANDCFALGNSTGGSAVLATTNAGTSWSEQSLPPTTMGLDALSCASNQDCEAVGENAIVGTTDGGATWSFQTDPDSTATLNAIDCAGPDACQAVGTDILSYG